MKSIFSWLGKAATYVANTKIGKVAVAAQLEFLNTYLKRPIQPEQISAQQHVVLSDLAFNETVCLFSFPIFTILIHLIPTLTLLYIRFFHWQTLNKQLAFSPLIVSSLWVRKASFTYDSLNVQLEDVVLVLKWNANFHPQGTERFWFFLLSSRFSLFIPIISSKIAYHCISFCL
jgi:hypothetical protein